MYLGSEQAASNLKSLLPHSVRHFTPTPARRHGATETRMTADQPRKPARLKSRPTSNTSGTFHPATQVLEVKFILRILLQFYQICEKRVVVVMVVRHPLSLTYCRILLPKHTRTFLCVISAGNSSRTPRGNHSCSM
jgi:hypothetical protein